MSTYKRSRKGRFLPAAGYVVTFVVSAYALYSVFNSLSHEHGTIMTPPDKSQTNSDLMNTALSTGDESHFLTTLKNILVPRVVGTPSHSKVKQYIIEQLKSFGWSVTSDIFAAKTPIFGELVFENIIAKLNPSAKEVVVLACHYDSKYFPNMEFLGATDSAVPCAMLLNLASCLQDRLNKLSSSEVSLELWFFDGEEAFLDWGPYDSLYGAKHLAQKMEAENTLSKIKCLILFDLLGPSKPVMYNYYNEKNVFKYLVASEKALRSAGHMKEHFSVDAMFFRDQRVGHYVEDDHTPFLQRDVPVIHVIPERFPDVWHTFADNFDAVDMDTVRDFNKILRLFVLKYFKL